MKITLSAIKADVGSVGGHTKPSPRMLDVARLEVKSAIEQGLLIDGFVAHTGDDIALLLSHTRGENSSDVHKFAWNTFLKGTEIAKEFGLYGAGQDLLVDAPSGNIRGAGPGVAELEFDHSLNSPRPAESFMLFAADKCGPGAYNLPLFLGFADPMYCAGLMLPQMIEGFRFDIIDMDNTEGDSIIELNAPEDSYRSQRCSGTTSASAFTRSGRARMIRGRRRSPRSACTRSPASTQARMIRWRLCATRGFFPRPRS
jgi:fructose 1,6-bisphosphate aldolase/phosphatase